MSYTFASLPCVTGSAKHAFPSCLPSTKFLLTQLGPADASSSLETFSLGSVGAPCLFLYPLRSFFLLPCLLPQWASRYPVITSAICTWTSESLSWRWWRLFEMFVMPTVVAATEPSVCYVVSYYLSDCSGARSSWATSSFWDCVCKRRVRAPPASSLLTRCSSGVRRGLGAQCEQMTLCWTPAGSRLILCCDFRDL